MFFELEYTDGNARAGTLQTAHGRIETPIFMPVGTQATVKGMLPHELAQNIHAQIILANTYHVYLRPGLEVLQAAGGIHRFMNWQLPILTDSGGYQVYSLAQNRKISQEGVMFQSHIDGSRHLFTPENVVDKQRAIGSDILMVLDECPPYPCEYGYAKKSLRLTHTWAKQARQYFLEQTPLYGYPQFQFGITQGSVFSDLRKQSADAIIELDFEGNAIGGLAVGEPKEQMYDMVAEQCSILPPHKPRYLMGVGTPANILEAIARGVDMMDCVMPTRNARHGFLFTWEGMRNIKNAKYKFDFSPIDANSDCYVDKEFSLSYLRHLFNAGEMLGLHIATLHNLHFYLEVVKVAREKILAGNFHHWKNQIVPILEKRI